MPVIDECDTLGQFISAIRIGGIFSDSIIINQVMQSGGKNYCKWGEKHLAIVPILFFNPLYNCL